MKYRNGRYKMPTVLAAISAAVCFTSLLLAWRGEDTSVWGSLLVFPGGFATGIAHSAIFIGLTSGVAEDEVAMAGSGLYLSMSVGSVVGSTGTATLFQVLLERGLYEVVKGLPDGSEVRY